MIGLGYRVFVPSCPWYPQGVVYEFIADDRAIVHFRIPNKPRYQNSCDSCGSDSLSVNEFSGEIICKAPFCGHKHGFDERNQVFPCGLLSEVTAEQLNERKARFREHLISLIQDGFNDGCFTHSEIEKVLAAIQ